MQLNWRLILPQFSHDTGCYKSVSHDSHILWSLTDEFSLSQSHLVLWPYTCLASSPQPMKCSSQSVSSTHHYDHRTTMESRPQAEFCLGNRLDGQDLWLLSAKPGKCVMMNLQLKTAHGYQHFQLNWCLRKYSTVNHEKQYTGNFV